MYLIIFLVFLIILIIAGTIIGVFYILKKDTTTTPSGPTKPPTEPTKPPTEPTKPPSEPTKPPSGPTNPPSGPTNPIDSLKNCIASGVNVPNYKQLPNKDIGYCIAPAGQPCCNQTTYSGVNGCEVDFTKYSGSQVNDWINSGCATYPKIRGIAIEPTDNQKRTEFAYGINQFNNTGWAVPLAQSWTYNGAMNSVNFRVIFVNNGNIIIPTYSPILQNVTNGSYNGPKVYVEFDRPITNPNIYVTVQVTYDRQEWKNVYTYSTLNGQTYQYFDPTERTPGSSSPPSPPSPPPPAPRPCIDENTFTNICNRNGKCLSIDLPFNQNIYDQVVQREPNGNDRGQRWCQSPNGQICNLLKLNPITKKSLCINAVGGNGDTVRLYTTSDNPDSAQKWSTVSGDYGNITNGFGKALASPQNSSNNNEKLIVWSPTDEGGQKWKWGLP